MERADVDSASFVDFSLICFCFSSSFASMLTRSSGMGLLSCCDSIIVMTWNDQRCHLASRGKGRTLNVWLNLTRSAILLSISFFINACFFFISLSFSIETKLRKAGTGSAEDYQNDHEQSVVRCLRNCEKNSRCSPQLLPEQAMLASGRLWHHWYQSH